MRSASLVAMVSACLLQLVLVVGATQDLCRVHGDLAPDFQLYWGRRVAQRGPELVYWCLIRLALSAAGMDWAGCVVDVVFLVPSAFSGSDERMQDVCPGTVATDTVDYADVAAVNRPAALVVTAGLMRVMFID